MSSPSHITEIRCEGLFVFPVDRLLLVYGVVTNGMSISGLLSTGCDLSLVPIKITFIPESGLGFTSFSIY